MALPNKKDLHLVLLSVLFLCVLDYSSSIQEDGFTFDMPEDDLTQPVRPPRPPPNFNHQVAVVGKVFRFVVHHQRVSPFSEFIAKSQNSKRLPHWLLFNKKTATFWGLPLPGDEGTLHITILFNDEATALTIQVVTDEDERTSTRKCKRNENNTILTLVLDKDLWDIKPYHNVVAVKSIAKFFSLPRDAFTLKPQYEKDDITDSSVVLAGPGDVLTKTSNKLSHLEVRVGCDGRLWESAAPLLRNLKQQAKDGTISEVLRLPLIGWRVKTETKPITRGKRQAAEDFGNGGSGDYDEDYYDDYEEGDYNEGNDLGDVENNPPVSNKPVSLPTSTVTVHKSKTSTITSTATSTLPSSSHPHRHHHGEIKPSGEYDPNVLSPVANENEPKLISGPETQSSNNTTLENRADLGPTKLDIPKPSNFDDSDSYDYDAYEDGDDDPIESETIVPIIEDLPKMTTTSPQKTTTFHDEEEDFETEVSSVKTPNGTTTSTTTTPTSEAPTTLQIVEDTQRPPIVIHSNVVDEPITPITSAATTPNSSETGTPLTTLDTTSITSSTISTNTTTTEVAAPSIEAVTMKELPATIPIVIATETASTQGEEFETKVTTPRHVSSTVTDELIATEAVEPFHIPPPQNTKPFIERRLQYKSVIAGKVFRYEIPKNTFKDAEDGYNLTLQVLDGNEQPLSKNSWLQFNPIRKELYGLPLAEDVSNWLYTIRAIDKEGASEQDQLTVQVQQHRLERVINHEFALNLRIEKPQEYPHYVDWSLKILRALGRIYNTNMSEITVRHINHTSEPVVFVWSNDSLATIVCQRIEIEDLYRVLTANDRGDPSRELSQLLAPDLRVKKVVSRDLTTCERQPVPPVTPTTNFSPILRNPVDKINATLGELLVYKVKDDTFYDPEDVDPLTLNITLLTADLEAIPSNNWLQFDSKNREFFGIPRKTGRTEYFLVCVDTGGMSAKDSLEVVVYPAVKRPYNVEFSMTIGVSLEEFSNNAVKQRKFVEKLMNIFEESTPGNFHFLPFKSKREANFDSTVVYWFNKSLPVESCPTDEIKRLDYMLHSDTSISSRVHRIMGPDFTVSTIKAHPIGNCKPKLLAIPTPEVLVPSEETPRPQAENDMMFTLILPIVIISIMVFVASLAACILYRKRMMGKMNMEEHGRQSFGNKGIPVIFQEELEEKPESGTKAPVILKEEKPPLAPPEYSRSGSLKLEDSEPYQPPPPFTRIQDNGRQPRPKPTPTYRKPPPYVPP